MKKTDPGYQGYLRSFNKRYCSIGIESGECADSPSFPCPFWRAPGACAHPYHPMNMPLEAAVFAEL